MTTQQIVHDLAELGGAKAAVLLDLMPFWISKGGGETRLHDRKGKERTEIVWRDDEDAAQRLDLLLEDYTPIALLRVDRQHPPRMELRTYIDESLPQWLGDNYRTAVKAMIRKRSQ